MTPLLLLAVSLAADLTVDHVSVSGTDLKQMQARLASIGIPSEYGGPHVNGATQMAVASFPDGSYLELIALQDHPDQKALANHYWSKQMLGNAGPTAWAVRSADVSKEAARLRTAGVTVSAPSRSGRKRPDGVQLDWETARVGTEPNGTFFPFLIRDFTPRDARAFPKGQPTMKDYAGISRVVIAVRDLKASIARYRQAYGLPAPMERDDSDLVARFASFAGTPVILAAPLSASSWLTQRVEKFGEGPCAFVLGGNKAGAKVSWFDVEKLGWHLGFEK
jgi:Glyoxalase-like domain